MKRVEDLDSEYEQFKIKSDFVITYKDFSEVKKLININKNPLALYIFSENKRLQR